MKRKEEHFSIFGLKSGSGGEIEILERESPTSI